MAAVVGALAATVLLVVAVAVDLDTADRVASVLGALAGVAALGASLYALRQPPVPTASAPLTVTITNERSVSAGGNISARVSTGDRLVDPPGRAPTTSAGEKASPATPSAPGSFTINTSRSVSAGGDITGVVSTGDTTVGGTE
ncbi:hypothetical protein ACIA8O_04690 [Kitasatospora sp. NPDC051853]|uniref:hypothetical protein n=1 Tax=Kitasatospora sp. NPDC051853 TaxID=3364058 RepID=UPI0037988E3C